MHSVRNDPRSIFKQREESFRLHPRLDEQALLEGSAFLINRGRYTKGTKANPKSTRSLCLFLCSPLCLLWCRSALGGATWRLKYFRKVKRHDRVSVARWNPGCPDRPGLGSALRLHLRRMQRQECCVLQWGCKFR